MFESEKGFVSSAVCSPANHPLSFFFFDDSKGKVSSAIEDMEALLKYCLLIRQSAAGKVTAYPARHKEKQT